MSVTIDEFSSRLRSLFNIDHADVLWMSGETYRKFREDPPRFLIMCDDEASEKIWVVVEWRNRPRSKLFDACAEIARTGIPRPLPIGDKS